MVEHHCLHCLRPNMGEGLMTGELAESLAGQLPGPVA